MQPAPMPALLELKLYQTARPIDMLNFMRKEGFLLLDPPYQRGDVWGTIRRRNLIRSIVQGVPVPALITNDRAAAGWDEKIACAVIDGKQRITALLGFMDSQFDVPGFWFEDPRPMVLFSELSEGRQRQFRHRSITLCEGTLPSLEAEQEVFELVNFGGVPQGETDTDT